MIWAGGLILAFLVYQLWGTGLIADRAQADAATTLESYFEGAVERLVDEGLAVPPDLGESSADPAVPVLYEEPAPALGTPFARIEIPAANVDHIMFEGVTRDVLKNGPGHMEWTPLPGQMGNSVLSGHRTTYGAPFHDLDLVDIGDEIIVQSATGAHVFEVREILIVAPDAIEVTDNRLGAWITLTTCHPKRSAAQRLVIHAELVAGPNFDFAEMMFPDVEGAAS